MKRLIVADDLTNNASSEPNDEQIEKLANAFAKMLESPPYDIKYQLETAYNLWLF